MFVETDFEGLREVAQAASSRGEEPVLDTFEKLRAQAMRRKILQGDIVRQATGIRQQDLAYLVIDSGLMEGFYVVDMGRGRAWRWETNDEGEEPYVANPPATTASGLPKICGTCANGQGPRYQNVPCSVHGKVLTTHHTCREWLKRSDL